MTFCTLYSGSIILRRRIATDSNSSDRPVPVVAVVVVSPSALAEAFNSDVSKDGAKKKRKKKARQQEYNLGPSGPLAALAGHGAKSFEKPPYSIHTM